MPARCLREPDLHLTILSNVITSVKQNPDDRLLSNTLDRQLAKRSARQDPNPAHLAAWLCIRRDELVKGGEMARSSDKLRARARERQRRLARDARQATPAGSHAQAHPDDGLTDDQRRRQAATKCGWCGGSIEPKARGRIPKWCSAACRQRAWEQSRAAASGRSAVSVVERRVEIPVRTFGVQDGRQPLHDEWVSLLGTLAGQLDSGAIYARDIPKLTIALNDVLAAYERHSAVRKLRNRL
jgi:hypothetical protein